jgi:hypothetical protein
LASDLVAGRGNTAADVPERIRIADRIWQRSLLFDRQGATRSGTPRTPEGTTAAVRRQLKDVHETQPGPVESLTFTTPRLIPSQQQASTKIE